MNKSNFLPHFFTVGPPRTATTWLHFRLPRTVSLPVTMKETQFFDKNFSKGLDWYRSQFDYRPGSIAGEIAPTYFYSSNARDRIASLIPEAKIICSFRDPVERLYSLYKMKRAYAFYRWTFEDALRNDHELIESARYAFHLREWQRLFGRANVMVLLYDDIKASPKHYLQRVCEFIGVQAPEHVDVLPLLSTEQRCEPRSYALAKLTVQLLDWMRFNGMANVVGRAVGIAKKCGVRRLILEGGADFSPLAPETETHLRITQAQEIAALEELIGRDLSTWKSN